MKIYLDKLDDFLERIINIIVKSYDDRIIISENSNNFDIKIIKLENNYNTNDLFISYEEYIGFNKNILSLKPYFEILNYNSKMNDEVKDFYLGYVLYNYILINTDLEFNKPIVLDPITSITYLINTKKSLSRFGDGELSISIGKRAPYGEPIEFYKDNFNKILNEDNKNLFIGICDIFHDTCIKFWIRAESKYWFDDKKWFKRYLSILPKNKTIYLSANISRVTHYKNINLDKYFEYYSKLYLNKEIVVVCNKNKFYSHLNNFLYPADKITFIIIKSERCSIDDEFIYENCIKYGKNKLILMYAGPYATYTSSRISKIENYRCIDSGSFYFSINDYDFEYLRKINNLTYKFNFELDTNKKYIIENDFKNADSKIIIDENDSLIIKFDSEILKNEYIKIHFKTPDILKKYEKVNCEIYLDSNSDCLFFSDKNILINNKENTQININFKINSWYIQPLNLDNNNFIIKEFKLKII